MAIVVNAVQTISALRLVSGVTDGDATIVDGYNTEGDGGGGTFAWNAGSSASDDGGIVILPTGHSGNGRWIRIHEPGFYNVRWWGTYGDNSIHNSKTDRQALQAAINYVCNLTIGTGASVWVASRI
jgi:hypothetical protein